MARLKAGHEEALAHLMTRFERPIFAFISSMPGAPSRPADVLEERNRVGLRAQLSSAQLEAVMARIAQPGLFKTFNPQERKP